MVFTTDLIYASPLSKDPNAALKEGQYIHKKSVPIIAVKLD